MAQVRRAYLEKQARQMAKEQWREDTLNVLKNDTRLERNIKDEERAEEKRLIRLMQRQHQEREISEGLDRAKAEKELRNRQLEQERLLAEEIARLKHEAQCDEKMRQQIRETAPEIRELEAKLRAAYVAKERQAQMAEKRAHEYDYLSRDAEILAAMKAESERAEAEKLRKLEERARERLVYQTQLERQLEEREEKKQKAYEEFLKEKLMIDEIVRKIYEEDHRARELELNKKSATQAFIKEFQAAREAWKIAERARMEQENRRILAYMEEQGQRQAIAAADKAEREHAKEAVQAALAKEIAQRERLRTEMEDIRQELVFEEHEEREREAERNLIEKRLRDRLELKAQHAEQMHYKRMREEAERLQEDAFRKQMMEKFAEDDRLEQLNAQKRRLKQQEHKREVERLLEERRMNYAAQRESEVRELEEASRLEAYRRQIIEEERQRLLKEHAGKLLGYLPRGVLMDEKDVEMLGPEFENEYRKSQFDATIDSEANDSQYDHFFYTKDGRRK